MTAHRQLLDAFAARRRAIAELYRDGESAPGIAEQFGVSPTSIYRILRREGVPIRRRGFGSGEARKRNRLPDPRYAE